MAFNNALRSAAKLVASSESSISTSGQILPFDNIFVICNLQILMQFVFGFTMMLFMVVLWLNSFKDAEVSVTVSYFFYR